MKTNLKFVACILVAAASLQICCKRQILCATCAEQNKPPIAVAGSDKIITLPTDSVLLDATACSDPDGMISSYLWTKISGPASFSLARPSDSIVKVTALDIRS